jgi:hypothetical protein
MYYIHGSEDSTDKDIIYVFDELPSLAECKAFCDGRGIENGNIVVIKNGVIASSFKGSIDEVNNGLFYTYKLHKQEFPLIIERAVERDVILKDIKVVRKILSTFTRTQYRTTVKSALRGSWQDKIEILKELDYKSVDFSQLQKASKADILKSFAFQIGQALALHQGVELYTKSDIGNYFPKLKGYLKRSEEQIDTIIEYIHRYADILESIPVKSTESNIVCFGEPYNRCYDINKEIATDTY